MTRLANPLPLQEGVKPIGHRARIAVPAFLYAKLSGHVPAPEILDLGCGNVYPEAYSGCPGLERVNLIDPNAHIRRGESSVSIYVNPEVSEGLPSIAMHPGFSLSHLFKFSYRTPPWSETLDKLKPSAICFCTYDSKEMARDLAFLKAEGYDPVTVEAHEEFRREFPIGEEASHCNMWAIVTRR
jgi:hypothetical protein